MAPPPVPIASYRRSLAVGVQRVWENVLDWEHLPWLHHSSFLDVAPLATGAWGWRARVGLPPAESRQELEIEVRVDRRAGHYTTFTRAGPGAGSEVTTRLASPAPGRTEIEVEFRVPGVAASAAPALGNALLDLYRRLWDEDESMMLRRDALAGRPRRAPRSDAVLELGPLEALRGRLPLAVELDGHPFRVSEWKGELVAHTTVCPHRLGPLEGPPDADGKLRCPWHGYVFELRSGRCQSGGPWQLAPAARVDVEAATGLARLVLTC